MLHKVAAVSTTATSPILVLPASATASSSSALSNPFLAFPKRLKLFTKNPFSIPQSSRPISYSQPTMNILNKLGFGFRSPDPSTMDPTIPQSPDDDVPAPGQQFAQFGAGCFWGVELAFQRVSGVTKTEVGYSQGFLHNPTYEKAAKESMERHQKLFNRKIVTEILPAKKFYRAEEYHQQYLAKGGRFGFKQSTEKGCNDPIKCYG
ncbi:unnamed protein product [Linum tenue]|uniref:peptide-methionine (S)-S-oxide reductase n=1 Tax=Linum tenue TaxID=586396 RepID=A0AAV0HGM7_9ROSI|nr:unnamed protein product [Linum tenue]